MPVVGRGLGIKPRKSRTKTGCVGCRTRRKKCDEVKPQCAACQRNGLDCVWKDFPVSNSPPKTSSAVQLRRASFVTSSDRSYTSSDPSLSPQPSEPLASSLDRISEVFFSHFVKVSAPQTIGSPRNPLLTQALPFAISQHDDMVIDAMLAYSGSHLSYKTKNPVLQSAAGSRYLSATKKLDRRLSSNNKLPLLITSLLLYHYENMAGGPSLIGLYHLRAANEFILSLSPEDRKSPLFGFLLEWSVYLHIINNSSCSDNSAAGFLWKPPKAVMESLKDWDSYGCMLGAAGELFALIPEISEAARSGQLKERYEELLARATNWKPQNLPRDDPIWSAKLLAMANIFQLGVEALLKSCYFGNLEPSREKFFESVKLLVTKLAMFVPELKNSPLETTLLWPVMMIGSCARTKNERDTMQIILNSTSHQMLIVDRAQETLKRAWVIQDDNMELFGSLAMGIAVDEAKFGMG